MGRYGMVWVGLVWSGMTLYGMVESGVLGRSKVRPVTASPRILLLQLLVLIRQLALPVRKVLHLMDLYYSFSLLCLGAVQILRNTG